MKSKKNTHEMYNKLVQDSRRLNVRGTESMASVLLALDAGQEVRVTRNVKAWGRKYTIGEKMQPELAAIGEAKNLAEHGFLCSEAAWCASRKFLAMKAFLEDARIKYALWNVAKNEVAEAERLSGIAAAQLAGAQAQKEAAEANVKKQESELLGILEAKELTQVMA